MDIQKKYTFTGKTKRVDCIELKQIVAIKDFDNIKAGDIGGWIEKEGNLSHSGNAWVSGDACVLENARVYGNARVLGHAMVFDNAWVCGDAKVYGYAKVYGHAKVYGDAWVYDYAKVYGNAEVYSNTELLGDAEIKKYNDYIVVGGVNAYNRFAIFFKCSDKTIKVSCGCFFGTISEFKKKMKKEHKGEHLKKVFLAMIDLAKLQLDDSNE